MRHRLFTIFGGTGFIGRYVVSRLADRGARLRVISRSPSTHGNHLQPLGRVDQIVVQSADLSSEAALQRAVAGSAGVVNLIGILHDTRRQRFAEVQGALPGRIAAAARAEGVARMVQISAIGADPASSSAYARSKAEGERRVLEAFPDATVLRPSIVIGPEDGFFNRFAAMARISPVLPLIGGGHTKFQPVYVTDVAEAVARAVDGKVAKGKIYELGGPDVLSFRDCLEIMLNTIDRKRTLVSLPFGVASFIGSIASMVPFITPPLTPDQVVLLKSDNVVSAKAVSEGRTLAGIGIDPTMLESILPTYLVRYRPQGQYTRSGRGA